MVTTPPVHIASARSSGPQHTSPSTASHSSVTPIANGRSQKRQHNLFGPYRLLRTLGEGEFGKVKLASHLDTKQEVAIKLIKKESIEQPSRRSKLMREISILQAVDHPFIVKVYEVIETRDYIGMIMEYASGGELFEHILAHRYLKEKEACRFFAQLVAGVSYLHSQNIVHRDLKLENLLLDGQRNVIITDFGFANRSSNDPESLLLTSCGSPCYAAPELVISDGYVGEAADIWSCGVILYAMLCGYLPFDDDPNNPDGDNINLLYKYILETELEFPDYVSQDARDLLKRMLVPDPRYRANMREVMNHWWLQPCAYFYAEEQSRVENKDLSTVAADDETSDEIVPLPKTPTPRPDSIYNTPPDTPRPVSIEEEPSIGVGVVPDMDSKVMDVDREEPSNYELGAYVTTKTSVGSAMSGIRVDDADALVPTVSMEVKAESVAVDHGLVPTASIVHEVARAAESDSSSEPDVIVIDDEHSGSQENQEDSDGPMVAIVHQASDGQTTAGTVGNSFTISSDIDVPAAVSRTPSVRDAVVPTAVRPVTAERRNSRAVAFSGKDALPVEGDVLVIEDEAEIQRQRDRERLREREEKKKVDYGRKSLDIRRIQRNESTTSRKSLFGWLRKNGQHPPLPEIRTRPERPDLVRRPYSAVETHPASPVSDVTPRNSVHAPSVFSVASEMTGRSSTSSNWVTTPGGSSGVPRVPVLRFHSGPIDQRALSSKPPSVIITEVARVLESMGMEVLIVDDFKVKAVRLVENAIPQRTMTQGSSRGRPPPISYFGAAGADQTDTRAKYLTTRSSIDSSSRASVRTHATTRTANGDIQVHIRSGSDLFTPHNSRASEQNTQNRTAYPPERQRTEISLPRKSGPARLAHVLASFPVHLVKRLKYMAQYGADYNKGFGGREAAAAAAATGKGNGIYTHPHLGASQSTITTTSSSAYHPSPSEYSVGSNKPSDGSRHSKKEIRFTVEVQKIKNLPGLFVVEFKRMKGNVWDFKRMYQDVVPKLGLSVAGNDALAAA